METWSWEWGNISYGVNWDGLANELQGKERKRQGDNNNTQKEPTPGAKHLGTLKKNRKKKEKKEKNCRPGKSTPGGHASTVANSQPRNIITSGHFSPNPLRLVIQEPAQLTRVCFLWRLESPTTKKDVGYTVPPILSICLVSIHSHTHTHHQPWPHPPAVRLRRSRLPAATRAIRPWHHRRRIEWPQQTNIRRAVNLPSVLASAQMHIACALQHCAAAGFLMQAAVI
jgi:hypothetical protein